MTRRADAEYWHAIAKFQTPPGNFLNANPEKVTKGYKIPFKKLLYSFKLVDQDFVIAKTDIWHLDSSLKCDFENANL